MYVAIAVAATYRWGFVAVASFYYFAPALAAPLGVPVFCPPFLSFASAPHPGGSGLRLMVFLSPLEVVVVARQGRKDGWSQDEAKQRFLAELATGVSVGEALKAARRSRSTYEQWRRSDADFVAAVSRVRDLRPVDVDAVSGHRGEQVGFSEFSERFLDARVFPHMQNVVDLIEGRGPSWLHEGMTFLPGERDLIMVNMPPEHAKTTSITINYVTYRICMDPNIRVILVSKTQQMAEKMLYAIKTRLTHPRYTEMIAQYAPKGGFSKDSEAWNKNMIYVSDQMRDSGEKDPTVQALGVRGHIYGARADLIVLDDTVDLTNAHEYDKQIDWIQSEVISRVSASGAMLIVGTRLAAKDMYSELRDPVRYPEETSPWTYLAMPAVLEYADDKADWVTLWPKSNLPELGARGDDALPGDDGLFPKWDGPRLAAKRARVSPRAWSMVYQQQQVADDGVFNPQAVKAAVNGNRMTGLIPRGMVGCREQGMDGLAIVAGLDPATAGHTAAVVVGLDVATQKRYVLDVFNKPGVTPEAMRDMIREWTVKYGIAEWRIERNGFQGFLVHDREINEFCASRGTVVRPHFTGMNKHDADFGVASMTTLFTGWEDKNQLIELPSTHGSEGAKALMEQLVTWAPELPKSTKTDIVMALWFAELACRDRVMMAHSYMRTHVSNPFLTPWDRQRQTTVNLVEMEAQRAWKPVGA